MEKLTDFTQLNVWQKAHAFVLDAYRVTSQTFRATAHDPYRAQAGRQDACTTTCRAAFSIAANIAEGFKRRTKSEKRNFYSVSRACLEEVRHYLVFEGEFLHPALVPTYHLRPTTYRGGAGLVEAGDMRK